MIARRDFLRFAGSVSGAISLTPLARSLKAALPEGKKPSRILLRSSWQTVNIGDIGHSPGVLALLEAHFPSAELFLWPSSVADGVEEMLQKRFPKLKILKSAEQRARAFSDCDFLLHGSGPSFVAEKDVLRWKQETGKPFGVYGITLAPRESSSTSEIDTERMGRTIELLGAAEFVYFRDSKSLDYARGLGCNCPVMEFGPDGAFACDLRNDKRADKFLADNALEPGNFLCCIPRLRYTPYWTIPSKNRPFDPVKHARNEEMKEHDHLQLRTAIIEVARNSKYRVLICPEDQTQMQVGRELLYEPLPDDVKRRVVWRESYWLTDEAVSTYVKSGGLFGNEMHSPIMCIGNGIPAIVCRFAEQTWKGHMWQDIGLGEWLFDLDDPVAYDKIVPAVVEFVTAPEKSKQTALAARNRVQALQKATMNQLEDVLA